MPLKEGCLHLLEADREVKNWEQKTTLSLERFASNILAAIFSEKAKSYEGQDYEKVWLTTNLALNKIALGDLEGARVDIKRTHEREAIIAKFKEQELASLEKEAKTKGVEVKTKELSGYPVETIDDPEVLKLKNGYQNALSHYLAGFLYEVLNEPSLAAPGYRKAIELKPDTPILEEGLNKLDERTSVTHKNLKKMTDVLFIVEKDYIPIRNTALFNIAVPSSSTNETLQLAFPVITPSTTKPLLSLNVDGTPVSTYNIVDNDLMARRALRDDMPGMLFRNITRAITKNAITKKLDEAGEIGGLVSRFLKAANTSGSSAGERMWQTLPERVYIARIYLAPGEHSLFNTETGEKFNFNVSGQYALVPIRLVGDGGFMGEVGNIGNLAH